MDHTLDLAQFRLLCPEFADSTKYPDTLIQTWFTIAGEYLGLTDYPCGLNGSTLDAALIWLTAHLMKSSLILSGKKGAPVFITSATIDKVTISTLPPPAKSAWDFWLAGTPYGVNLWGLLSLKSVGGWSYGGNAELGGFRRAFGIFR